MINLLCDDLTKSIVVNDKEYSIYTDFREWITMQETLINSKDELEIFTQINNIFINEIPSDLPSAFPALIDFMTRAQCREVDKQEVLNKQQEVASKPVFSYIYDAPYIIGGFLECYGINLLQIDYLHWWIFNALLESLNSQCALKQRIMYRSMDVSKIKDKQERIRVRRIQQSIALPSQSLVEEDIANVFL